MLLVGILEGVLNYSGRCIAKDSVSQLAYHIGHIYLYGSFNVITYIYMIGFVPIFFLLHVEISIMLSFNISFVIAKNYRFSGLKQDKWTITSYIVTS